MKLQLECAQSVPRSKQRNNVRSKPMWTNKQTSVKSKANSLRSLNSLKTCKTTCKSWLTSSSSKQELLAFTLDSFASLRKSLTPKLSRMKACLKKKLQKSSNTPMLLKAMTSW